jgi:signal-transduction protein with cAMP-binding, CBS, and nucleotidyltransferase domain
MTSVQVPVSAYMSSPAITIPQEASLEQAFRQMQDVRVSALVVVRADGTPAGLLRRADLLRVGRNESGRRPGDASLTLPDRPVSEEMSQHGVILPPSAPLTEAAQIMVRERTHRVLVGSEAQIEGILTTRDLMRALEDKKDNHIVQDFMSSPVFTIRAEEPVSLAVERLERARVTGLVVVENAWPIGLFTDEEALESRDVARHTAVEDVMSTRLLALRPDTRLHRAAAQACATRVRRVVVQDGDRLAGILTGLDFARALLS